MALLLSIGLVAACSEDPGDSGGQPTLRLTVNPPVGEVNGPPLTVTVTGVQGNGSPMAQGTIIDIGELAAFSGDAAGVVGWWGEGEPADTNRGVTAGTITTLTGSVTAKFNCEKAGQATLIAAPRGNTQIQGVAMLTCNPGPSGDWTVTNIGVTEGQLRVGGGAVKVSATVLDGEGAAVGAGTSLKFSIDSGESLQFATGAASVNATTNEEGVATVNMKTGTAEGETVLRVAFADSRYGQPSTETFRVRPEGGADQTIIEVTVKRGAAVVGINDRRVLADGQDFLTVEATVVLPDSASVPLTGHPLDFRLVSGPGYLKQDANDPNERAMLTQTLDASGGASAQFFGGDAAGGAMLQLSTTNPDPNGTEEQVTAELTIAVTALGFIEFEGVTPGVLYVRGNGQNESATLTFKVLDTNRQVLTGVPVRFSLRNPPSGTTASPLDVVTNEFGKVETTVQSGTSIGAFSVTATATVGSVTLEAPSTSIPIVGALPSRAGFTFQCEYENIGGLIDRQGTVITQDSQYDCRSVLTDRFGNRVGVAQRVTYLSEGGDIVSPQTSIEWNTQASPNAPPDNVGTVSAPYSPGGQAPCDVDELPGEPWWEDGGACTAVAQNCAARLESGGMCRFNPRDGLVTLVAITRGEEAFTDVNQNGTYDDGEPFWDIGEPYVDTNDNNMHDTGERFVDLSEDGEVGGNQVYDPPNGEWDPLTSIWVVTHVLLTGEAYEAYEPAIADMEPQTNGDLGIGFPFSIDALTPYTGTATTSLAKWWMDKNLNRLNLSARFTIQLLGAPRGVTLETRFEGLEGDDYGFGIAYVEDNVSGPLNRYTTEIDFPAPWPGDKSIAVLRLTPPYDPVADVQFTATYQVAPGAGSVITERHTYTVILP